MDGVHVQSEPRNSLGTMTAHLISLGLVMDRTLSPADNESTLRRFCLRILCRIIF